MNSKQLAAPPLIVHTNRSRVWGGQEIRILTELRAVRKLGFATALMVPAASELARRGAAEGFAVYPTSFASKLHPSCWWEAARLIHRLRPAVVNTHSSEDSWIALCVARLCRVPLVIRTRHVSAPISSSVSYNLFPHLIFTCSAAIGGQLASQGVRTEKLLALPTGVNEERFRFSPENRKAVRAAYGIGEDEILVGNVAFLRHYKGHDFILRTAARMPERYRFILVGDGEERARLESLARELGVQDRILFAGHQEMPEGFFSAMDIFFFSSYEAEGVAQSLIQSLLNGLPVLACRIPSTMEVLKEIEACRLIDYDDVAAACAGLSDLAALPRRDPQGMEAQWRTIAGQYGLQNMVSKLLAAYARFGIKAPAPAQRGQ